MVNLSAYVECLVLKDLSWKMKRILEYSCLSSDEIIFMILAIHIHNLVGTVFCDPLFTVSLDPNVAVNFYMS